MRRAAAVDENQGEVVAALRAIGCSVTSLAGVGNGVPDLLVGFRQQTYLLEVKDGRKVPSKRRLTKPEQDWALSWRGGEYAVVECAKDALKAVGAR